GRKLRQGDRFGSIRIRGARIRGTAERRFSEVPQSFNAKSPSRRGFDLVPANNGPLLVMAGVEGNLVWRQIRRGRRISDRSENILVGTAVQVRGHGVTHAGDGIDTPTIVVIAAARDGAAELVHLRLIESGDCQ